MSSRRESSPPETAPQTLDETSVESGEVGSALLELVLANEAERQATPAKIDGVVVGRVVAVDGGKISVDYPSNAGGTPVMARAMASVTAADAGREVALMFEESRADRPIVMGFMSSSAPPAAVASADGKRLVFEASKEIVLRCGEASITLTRAGKIIIEGAYVLSRSTGVHRIQGGSVQIN